MKILHTADWHIGQFKGPVVDGVNLRSQDTVNCLNYMIKVAEEEKPDIVCVSGDVFHQEQIGPVRYSDEMIVATDTITKLAGVAKAVIVMRGTPNHDGGGQFRVLSKMFANTGNVHIVTSPTVLRTPYADIACIPGFDKQEFRSRFPGLSADEENEALDESEIQKMKEANEKREQKAVSEETPDNNSENSSEKPNTSDNPTAGGQSTTEAEPEITETRKFVICPNCGEKIWL